MVAQNHGRGMRSHSQVTQWPARPRPRNPAVNRTHRHAASTWRATVGAPFYAWLRGRDAGARTCDDAEPARRIVRTLLYRCRRIAVRQPGAKWKAVAGRPMTPAFCWIVSLGDGCAASALHRQRSRTRSSIRPVSFASSETLPPHFLASGKKQMPPG